MGSPALRSKLGPLLVAAAGLVISAEGENNLALAASLPRQWSVGRTSVTNTRCAAAAQNHKLFPVSCFVCSTQDMTSSSMIQVFRIFGVSCRASIFDEIIRVGVQDECIRDNTTHLHNKMQPPQIECHLLMQIFFEFKFQANQISEIFHPSLRMVTLFVNIDLSRHDSRVEALAASSESSQC